MPRQMRSTARDVARYLVNLARWLGRAWRVWGSVGVIVLSVAVASMLPGSLEAHIRYAGLFLQLLGVCTVVYLLSGKHHLFGRRGLWASTRQWAAERPRFRGSSTTLIVASAGHAHISGEAKITKWFGTPPTATVEERLHALESNLQTVRADLAESRLRATKHLQKVEAAIQTERHERTDAVREVSTKLQKLGADGLHVEAVGLLWLIVGIVLATIPAEVAHLWLLLLQ